jgi:hypothetical protein
MRFESASGSCVIRALHGMRTRSLPMGR